MKVVDMNRFDNQVWLLLWCDYYLNLKACERLCENSEEEKIDVINKFINGLHRSIHQTQYSVAIQNLVIFSTFFKCIYFSSVVHWMELGLCVGCSIHMRKSNATIIFYDNNFLLSMPFYMSYNEGLHCFYDDIQ